MPVMFTYIRVYESINYQDIQMLAQPQINLNLTKTDFASPQPWEELHNNWQGNENWTNLTNTK